MSQDKPVLSRFQREFEEWWTSQDALGKSLASKWSAWNGWLAAIEHHWVSVEDRLPDEDGQLWAVLTDSVLDGHVVGYYPLYEFYYSDNGWATYDKITHWLDVKLPQFPPAPHASAQINDMTTLGERGESEWK